MRIWKRGRYYWVAWPGDDRESTGCTTRPAARAWCQQRELQRANPAHAAALAQTVGSLIAAFIADRAGLQRAPATLEYYRQKLGHAARLFGVRSPLTVFTAQSIDAYQGTRLTEGATQHTVAKEIRAIGAMLRKAKRWRWLAADLDELLPTDLASGYTPRRGWLPPDDLDLLLEELVESAPAQAGAVAYAVASGGRAAEIARATRGDLEAALATGLLAMRGSKTAKSKGSIAVVSLFRPLLERALAWALPGGPEAMAFGAWSTDKASRPTLAWACKRAGVERVTWNDLRRSHGRWLRRGGVTIELIAEQLRHTSPDVTRRVYAQIEAAEVSQQIEAQLLSAGCQEPTVVTVSNGHQPEAKPPQQSG